MTENIKLLEELVVEAVDRLRSLTREREELREEIRSLQERLEDAQRQVQEQKTETAAGPDGQGRRDRALAVLREALSELREDGSAA